MTDASPDAEIALHPLVQEAIASFAPRGGPSPATHLLPDSPGTIALIRDGDLLRPSGPMARWARKRLRDQSSGVSTLDAIFLAEGLATWVTADQPTFLRHAPQRLTPLAYDDKNRTFAITGPAAENREFAAALATRNGKITAVDRDFMAAIVLSTDARAAMRQVDPRENPGALEAPAFCRLLGLPADEPKPVAAWAAARSASKRKMPLDEDQHLALQTALSGVDTIIHGPPGTGKSEVIAEIARTALAGGNDVLIASSVQSAIDVARRRLDATGDVRPYDPMFHGPTLEFLRPDGFKRMGKRRFDLLIVDEATRMTVSEALLLASRCKQLVICGDPRQLGAPEGQKNLFAHARDLGFAEVMLKKHYRSASGDLIYFSNLTCYDLALRVVPSPDLSTNHGVSLPHKCELAQSKAGTINHTEAKIIVDKLEAYAKSSDPRSLCVITTSAAQVTAIRDLMEVRGLTDAQLTRCVDEPFFVRIVNQVQGEERDYVMLSLVIAPENGSMDGCFGIFQNESNPLERLNVAMSRARSRMEIVASFLPAHLGGEKFGLPQQIFYVFFQAIGAALISNSAFRVHKVVESVTRYIRRPNDRLANLGLIYAWAKPGAKAYDLAILIRYVANPPEIWDAAAAQLRVAGWKNVIQIEEIDLQRDIGEVCDRIEKAARAA
jgi:hypothetical protein